MRNRLHKRALVLLIPIMFGLSAIGANQFANQAAAGPEIVGNPDGATDRVLMAPAGKAAERIVYFAAGAQTPVGINTPVASDAVCKPNSTVQRIDAYLVGTMTGTAPTLTITSQHSLDGGTTWVTVGTWTVINATVTPVSQTNTFGDIYNATTPVVYGDCWRVTKTYGGSGSVGGDVEIVGIAK